MPQTVDCFFGGVQKSAHPSFERAAARMRNRIRRSVVSRSVEVLLAVLLLLMIPGLVTYLRPRRAASADRADS